MLVQMASHVDDASNNCGSNNKNENVDSFGSVISRGGAVQVNKNDDMIHSHHPHPQPILSTRTTTLNEQTFPISQSKPAMNHTDPVQYHHSVGDNMGMVDADHRVSGGSSSSHVSSNANSSKHFSHLPSVAQSNLRFLVSELNKRKGTRIRLKNRSVYCVLFSVELVERQFRGSFLKFKLFYRGYVWKAPSIVFAQMIKDQAHLDKSMGSSGVAPLNSHGLGDAQWRVRLNNPSTNPSEFEWIRLYESMSSNVLSGRAMVDVNRIPPETSTEEFSFLPDPQFVNLSFCFSLRLLESINYVMDRGELDQNSSLYPNLQSVSEKASSRQRPSNAGKRKSLLQLSHLNTLNTTIDRTMHNNRESSSSSDDADQDSEDSDDQMKIDDDECEPLEGSTPTKKLKETQEQLFSMTISSPHPTNHEAASPTTPLLTPSLVSGLPSFADFANFFKAQVDLGSASTAPPLCTIPTPDIESTLNNGNHLVSSITYDEKDGSPAVPSTTDEGKKKRNRSGRTKQTRSAPTVESVAVPALSNDFLPDYSSLAQFFAQDMTAPNTHSSLTPSTSTDPVSDTTISTLSASENAHVETNPSKESSEPSSNSKVKSRFVKRDRRKTSGNATPTSPAMRPSSQVFEVPISQQVKSGVVSTTIPNIRPTILLLSTPDTPITPSSRSTSHLQSNEQR